MNRGDKIGGVGSGSYGHHVLEHSSTPSIVVFQEHGAIWYGQVGIRLCLVARVPV